MGMVAESIMKRNTLRSGQSGFTLMELLISISIIAVLMAIGIASYGTINRQSRDTRRKSDLEQVRSALEMYRADNGYYPTASGGTFVDIATGLADLVSGGYISALPTDPKSTQVYEYKATSLSGSNYFGYCLSGRLEAEDPSDSCTPDTANSHNFGAKNP